MSLKPNNDNMYCFVPCDMEVVTRGGCACHNRVSCQEDLIYNFKMKVDNTDRNWKEDFHLENGNYMNKCMCCSEIFLGHKRRVVCRLCAIEKGYIPANIDDLI
jgi:hypothetical protein